MQDYITIYDAAENPVQVVKQVIDASLNDRLDGTLTLSFVSKINRLPEIAEDTLIGFRGQYYRSTQVQSSVSGNAFLLSVSCEQESISLVDMEVEEFNFTGSADDALARLLDGTGITATAEHTGTITISASGGNRRSILLEIAELCEGEIEYSGHHIYIRKRRGNTDPIDIVRVCRCSDVTKTFDLRNGSESYEITGLNPDGYAVGDEVILDFAPLGIHVQKRIIGISYNPFDCRSVSVEAGDYITDITDDYASLEKIFLMKADAKITFEKYINSVEGKTALSAALEGTYVTATDLNGYVEKGSLEATIAGYIKPGEASLVNALNGSYVSETALGDYVKTTSLASSVTQEIKDGKVKLELSASEESSTESIKTDVGIKNGDVYIPDIDTTLYEFSDKDSEGYYVSRNAGVEYSCSYMRLDFNFTKATEVTFRCICMGESVYDYGLISAVDCELTVSYLPDDSPDHSNVIINEDVFYSFRNKHSTTPVDVVMTIPAGSHFVTFKYVKDQSANGTGDYFKVCAFVVETETTSSKSTITLTAGGVKISSADITFKGYVTFESLSTPGATTIDGANVTTDNLHVKKIYMGENYGSNEILNSTVSSNTGVVKIGFINNFMSSSYIQGVGLYANILFIAPPGGDMTSDNAILVDIRNRTIAPNANWRLYNTTIMN